MRWLIIAVVLILVVLVLAAVVAGAPGQQAAPPSGNGPTASTLATPTPEAAAGPGAVPTIAVGPTTATLPNPETVRVPPAGTCHVVNGLPDRACTPGVLNPRLTPAELCARGFSTKSIRPPTSYTDTLKKRLMASYGQVGTNPSTGRPWSTADVELDHLVSLEDLGHPWSPLNLWPEPRRATGVEPNADEKDQVETAVHRMICADPTHAAEYAARLAADWTQFRRTALATSTDEPKETEP